MDGKTIGIASVLMAGILGAAFGLSALSNNALESRIAEIDDGPSHVFNSVADCVAEGFTAEQAKRSFERARDLGDNFGAIPLYDSEDKCAQNHNDYKVVYLGQPPVPWYTPNIVGWQVDADDIDVAVALYSGKTENMAVRADGRQFRLRP